MDIVFICFAWLYNSVSLSIISVCVSELQFIVVEHQVVDRIPNSEIMFSFVFTSEGTTRNPAKCDQNLRLHFWSQIIVDYSKTTLRLVNDHGQKRGKTLRLNVGDRK